MTLTSKQRESIAIFASALFGMALVLSVGRVDLRSVPPKSTTVMKVSTAMRFKPVQAAKPVTAIAPPLPIQTATAPATKPKQLKSPTAKPPALAPTTPAVEPAITPEPAPVIEQSTTVPMVQPGIGTTREALPAETLPGLNPTAQSDKPPLPSDEYLPPEKEYLEKPGGEVLVMGLLVDSNGQVVDSRILVPSYNGLGDLSYALIARKEHISDIDPPIAPGETRWLEIRVAFPKKNDLLP